MVDLAAAAQHTPPAPPAFITCGPHILDRVAGDYPTELVYLANVAGFALWVKSKDMLAGPWDWILVGPSSPTPVNFEGPFLRREDATESLCDFLERSRLLAGAVPDAIAVEASPHDDSAADAYDQPRPRASVADTSAAAVAAHIDVSPEYIRMALDLAIAGLVSARARVAPAPR